jgi:hypothetical protein
MEVVVANSRYYPDILRGGTAGVPAGIRTEHPLNTSLERSCSRDLLGRALVNGELVGVAFPSNCHPIIFGLSSDNT